VIQNKSAIPVVEGFVGHQHLTVLGDTTNSGVVLKRTLARLDQMTGKTRICTVTDGGTLQVPTAEIEIDTPYYKGVVIAWCMETPIYDLILGNIEGVREPDKPNPTWNL